MNQSTQNQLVDQLLPRRTVEKQAGISRATVYRLMKAGKFPHPVSIGVGARLKLTTRAR